MLLFLLCVASAYTVVQASRWWHLPPAEQPLVPVPYAEKLAEQRRLLSPRTSPPTLDLQEHRGRVLVICAGSVGKPETESWLRQLTHLQKQLPFPAHADPVASVAESLGHRFDPTLHVVGKWGAVRYAGDLEMKQLPRMLVMLTKEREKGDRQFFNSRGADVGHLAPDFSLPDREGREVTLRSLQGRDREVILLFAGADVRAGPSLMGWLAARVASVGSERVQAGIVYSLVDAETVRQAEPVNGSDSQPTGDVHVLIDESGEVAGIYRSDQPPLLIVIGPRGIIRYRGDSAEDAEAAMAATLQLTHRPSPTALPLLPP